MIYLLRRGVIALVLFLIAFAMPLLRAQDSITPPEGLLYGFAGHALRDSRWGKIALFQQALARHLRECRRGAIVPDGIFGRGTREAIVTLTECPGYEAFRLPPEHPLYGTIYQEIWEHILPHLPLPTPHERAFVLSLSHEGTDYDMAEWNYTTPDDRSALTWGPYGATVGWGNEVRAILARIHMQDSALLLRIFGDEFPLIRRLIEGEPEEGYSIMRPAFEDSTRRWNLRERFKLLGAEERAREAYEWYAFRSDSWLRPPLRSLYSLIPGADTAATEVDYAFFLDIVMHMGIGPSRIEACADAIATAVKERRRMLRPAERRRLIAHVLVPTMRKRDRLGRNVVYFVDGIGEGNLTREERDAWEWRTGRRASECGLSDERRFFPDPLR